MSCWKELLDAEQDDLINTLESVLRLPSAATQSREISQVILNLEEFMAHADKVSTFLFLDKISVLSVSTCVPC